MAFPTTELPVTVQIAPGADPSAASSSWSALWVDITDDVRVAEGIVIEQGRSDEAAHIDPGKCTLTIDNRSGDYSPRNPLGAYYGDLRRNTPLRVLVTHSAVDYELFVGTVQEWPTRWDQSGNNGTAPVVATGILRRLSQGQSELRSPIYRQLTRYSPAGYWPLEDGSDATRAASALTGGRPAQVSDVTFDSDTTLPGSATSLKFNSTSSLITGTITGDTTSEFAVMLFFKLAALPVADSTLIELRGQNTARRWTVGVNAAGFTMAAYTGDGTLLSSNSAIYVVDPTEWVAVQLEIEQDGSNVDWTLIWHQVGDESFWFFAGTFAGTCGRVTSFRMPGSTSLVDATFAHVWAGPETLPFVDATFAAIARGYSGELASDRIERLCAEEGVEVVIESGDSSPVGPQRVDTFLELLRSAEDADQGLLYESSAGLRYRPHVARYNRFNYDLGLNVASGHLAEPPEPTDDDQRIRNDWTVKRDGGSEYRYVDQDHVDTHGRYDESATVNVETDDDLEHQAGWRVHMGTLDELRWPRISISLARNPSLISDWLDCGIGSRLLITNAPSQVAGDPIDLLIEGYTQVLKPYSWDVELNCSPARLWDVGIYDDTDTRYDTSGASLASSATSGATSLSVASDSSDDLWTTDAGQMPIDINVGGEQVRVTAISGTSSPQTFTVTRGMNGITKAHAAGTDVRLWRPAHYAL